MNIERLNEVIFANPGFIPYLKYVVYAVLVTLAVIFFRFITRPKKTYGSRYPFIGKAKYILFAFGAIACSLVALARPYLPQGGVELRQGAVDVVVAIDTSVSMFSFDIEPFRLEVAKLNAYNLVARGIVRPGDRIALFTFNGNTVRQLYLTKDTDRYLTEINDIVRPRSFLNDETRFFTDYALALEHIYLSLDRQDRDAGLEVPRKIKNRLIFIFSDGDDRSGDRERIAVSLKALNARGVKIYPIGIGTIRGVKILNVLRWHGYKAGKHYKRHIDKELRFERTRLNKRTLGYLKDQTNGRMVFIEDSDEDVYSFMKSVVDSHRSFAITPRPKEGRLELWKYCLYGAIFFLFLLIVLY